MLLTLEKIVKWCARVLMGVGAVAIVLMMVHVMAEAASRRFFDYSIPGTEEFVSAYYMVAVVFLPLGYVQLERGHVIIELFTLKASNRTKAWMDGSVLVLCGLALAVFTYAGVQKAIDMTAQGEFWIGLIDVTIWPTRWVLPVGLGVMALIMFLQAFREFHSAVTGVGYRESEQAEDAESV